MDDTPIYYGNSMHSVFARGERLKLETVSFESLVAGDIVAVQGEGRQYVHRIVEKNADVAVTMGDNNLHPDREKLVPESKFFLVTGACNSTGCWRSVTGGAAGMKKFYKHQRRQRLRRWAGGFFLKMEKIFFWRRPLTESREFGSEICYYHHSRVIARRAADGRVIYVNWKQRLLYYVPGEKLK